MKASFRYEDTRYGTQIVWCDEDDCGAIVGQDWRTNKDATAPDRLKDEEAWATWAAEHAARPFAETEPRGTDGFYFATSAAAAKAMRAIKAALKAKRPLLEWEKSALAAGWVPPKGWTGEVVVPPAQKKARRQ